jgi:hypothetical protein
MPARSWRKIQSPEHAIKLVTGAALIASGGAIESVSGEGVRSGSSSGATHTLYLGTSGSNSLLPGDKYNSVRYSSFSVRPTSNRSDASYAGGVGRAFISGSSISSAGTIDFCIAYPSGNVTTGEVTEIVRAPNVATTVDFFLVLKDSNI